MKVLLVILSLVALSRPQYWNGPIRVSDRVCARFRGGISMCGVVVCFPYNGEVVCRFMDNQLMPPSMGGNPDRRHPVRNPDFGNDVPDFGDGGVSSQSNGGTHIVDFRNAPSNGFRFSGL